MAARRNARPPETVRSEDDAIVVTVTAPQAAAMAAAMASSSAARHDEFVSDLARSLAVAARPKSMGPTLSRGAFIRGRWSAAGSSTTSGPLSGLAISDDVVEVGPAEAQPRTLAAVPDVAAQGDSPRLQDMDPTQWADHQRRAAEVVAEAAATQVSAAQATQAAAVLQSRTDAAVVRAAGAHDGAKDEVEALELAEENALSAAAVARAVAAAATQAAETAAAAAAAFESEVASAVPTGGTSPGPRPPSANRPPPAEERQPESAQIS